MFVFGDFNVHHRDWLIYSCGTNRPHELYYNFSISIIIFLSHVTLLRWLTFLLESLTDSHSPALLDLFISSDASICSAVTFHPLGKSNLAVVSVSNDFPLNSKRHTPFHRLAYDLLCWFRPSS